MNVVHFHRKRRPNANYSIEGFYNNVRETLKDRVQFTVSICPFESNGVIRRFLNTVYAAFKQSSVNHITGDVNYLNFFFNKHKNIVTILDCGLLDRISGFKYWIAKLIWFQLPVANAKFVIAISQATKNEILKHINCHPDKIKVIHVAVSPIFKKADKTFNKQKPVILHIGTAPNKNLSGLIKAAAGLNCKIVIIGYLNDYYKTLLKNNSIEFENYYDITDAELYEHYKRSDILFFASTYEGFGMPIVEANITGIPVITSGLYSMPEVAGDAALIVDPYNIDEIRNALIKIIEDDNLRNELVLKGFKNSERFDLKTISMEYYKIYKSIAQENGKV